METQCKKSSDGFVTSWQTLGPQLLALCLHEQHACLYTPPHPKATLGASLRSVPSCSSLKAPACIQCFVAASHACQRRLHRGTSAPRSQTWHEHQRRHAAMPDCVALSRCPAIRTLDQEFTTLVDRCWKCKASGLARCFLPGKQRDAAFNRQRQRERKDIS
jgi:hypothetical protein